jgi:hypothetical protein
MVDYLWGERGKSCKDMLPDIFTDSWKGLKKQKEYIFADISVYKTRKCYTKTIIYPLPRQIRFTDVGGLLVDGKRIFS